MGKRQARRSDRRDLADLTIECSGNNENGITSIGRGNPCELPFVICRLSFAICHLTFAYPYAQLPDPHSGRPQPYWALLGCAQTGKEFDRPE
jgi:hypothetical protein